MTEKEFPESTMESELRVWGEAVGGLREAYVQARNDLARKIFGFAAILRYLVTGYCGYSGCGYVESYGFVPEAGCPVHGADTWLSRWVRKMRKGREQAPWRVLRG